MAKRGFLRSIFEVRRQYAALPFRRQEGLEVMLITSRERRRWVIPKGWPMKGKSRHGAAAQEALEEAGIQGAIKKKAVGSYIYVKRGIGGISWPCTVFVYPLAVHVEQDDWLEKAERTRQWFSYIEAAEAVEEPDLRALILAFGLAFDD
jgi:8-oxo-dGTP pyrophosphatase MutT (NUDIX family)